MYIVGSGGDDGQRKFEKSWIGSLCLSACFSNTFAQASMIWLGRYLPMLYRRNAANKSVAGRVWAVLWFNTASIGKTAHSSDAKHSAYKLKISVSFAAAWNTWSSFASQILKFMRFLSVAETRHVSSAGWTFFINGSAAYNLHLYFEQIDCFRKGFCIVCHISLSLSGPNLAIFADKKRLPFVSIIKFDRWITLVFLYSYCDRNWDCSWHLYQSHPSVVFKAICNHEWKVHKGENSTWPWKSDPK